MTINANLPQLFANVIAVMGCGLDFSNLAANGYNQIKTGLGVFGGVTVNTGGTTSSVACYDGNSATVTITIATPGVVTWTAHGKATGDAIKLTTTGALPTGLASGTTVYVVNPTTDTFELSDTRAHALAGTNIIDTTGSQSGVHTGWDVTRPMGSFSTLAQNFVGPPNGLRFNYGLIAIAAGGAAADITINFA